MNTASHVNAPAVPSWRVSYLRTANGLLLGLAIVQIIVGCLALSYSFVATLVSVSILGALLLIASAVEMAAAITPLQQCQSFSRQDERVTPAQISPFGNAGRSGRISASASRRRM